MLKEVNNFFNYILIILIVIITACKKQDLPALPDIPKQQTTTPPAAIPVITPMSYFPAWPGSYWVYGGADTLSVEDKFQLCSKYVTWYNTPPPFETVYMPRFKRNKVFTTCPNNAFIHGYLMESPSARLLYRTLLEENLYQWFRVKFSGAADDLYNGRTIAVDTTIQVNNITYNNVIVVINYRETVGELIFDWHYREYYAKNVGLIKREYRNPLVSEQIYTVLELKSYFINH